MVLPRIFKMLKCIFLAAICAFGLPIVTLAQLRLPAIFSDNMVLQQDTEVNIWGWGAVGDRVIITPSWAKEEISTLVGSDGKWKTVLRTPKTTNKTVQLNIQSAGQTIMIDNVLLGEVWFCSGQSNMDFPIAKSTGWRTGIVDKEAELQDADYPQIRFFHVQQALSPFKELDDCAGEWKIVSPDNIKDFSAVAFFFGRAVFQGIGQPIGLIQSTWGGTPAESWTKMSYMKDNTLYKTLLEERQRAFDRYPSDSAAYVTANKEYELSKEQDSTLSAPKKPSHPSNNNTLATLWNAMVNPVVPFTMKGVIWYQGESNNIRAADYTHVLSNLIRSWRKEWQQGEFPFYFVQIAPHYKQDPEIREAQLETWRSIRNTGMVVITDAGDSTDIHPRNKRIPGERLAYWALADTYGKDITFSGPLFRSVDFAGESALVSFDYAGSGLQAKGGVLKGFEIAARDGVFYPADAQINGSKVVLSAHSVREPRYVRYGWGKFFNVNLYNKEGLPASPFRSSIGY